MITKTLSLLLFKNFSKFKIHIVDYNKVLMEYYEIVTKTAIAPLVTKFEIYTPEIAQKRRAGQFVMIRVDEEGERIPLTIADAHPDRGTITLISQRVGKTTSQLAAMKAGERLQAVAGPLGSPTHIEHFGTVICIGGGIGIAPLYPIAQAMRKAGNAVISILGARSKNLLILKEEMRAISDELIITTDDGSEGQKGFVTDFLHGLLSSGKKIDQVTAIGPAIMMKRVAETTRPFAIPTIASLNTIMVDGTGMCGGCRISSAGKIQFVCVDGPEFDAHQVDWDEMMNRLNTYREHECLALNRFEEKERHIKNEDSTGAMRTAQ